MIRPCLAALFFTAVSATGLGYSKDQLVALDAARSGLLAEGEQLQREVARRSKLIRHEAHTADTPAAMKVLTTDAGTSKILAADSGDEVTVNLADEVQENDCDETSQDAAALSEDQVSSHEPDEAEHPGGHPAPILGTKKGRQTTPCRQLKKLITPGLVPAHVEVVGSDGNNSQVPDGSDLITQYHKRKVKKSYVISSFYSLLSFVAVIGLCGIAGQRMAQDSKAKALQRDRSEEVREDIDYDKVVADLVQKGATAGAIATATKQKEKAEAKAKAKGGAQGASSSGASSSAAAAAPKKKGFFSRK